MTNLIDNACKYSEHPNPVKVVTTFADSDKVLIKVIDKGIGINKDSYEKIFDKFVRLENYLTSKAQGNGLGLFITKQLVEDMAGSIYLNSTPGEGTCFSLEFPFYNQEEALRCSQQS